MSTRADGFYWVRESGYAWQIAEWVELSGGYWCIGTIQYTPDSFEVGPRIPDPATLEGMAAPGEIGRVLLGEAEWQHFIECMNSPSGPTPAMIEAAKLHRQLTSGAKPWDNKTVEHWRAVEQGDSPSPQQPTQEALRAAADALPITWGRQLVRDVALALDRFAAQRVTAAQAHPDEARAYAYLQDILFVLAPQCEPRPDLIGLCTQVDRAAVAVRDAATDKARREARDEVAEYVDGYGDVTNKKLKKIFRALAEGIRALDRFDTPQNPGDAAPEGGE